MKRIHTATMTMTMQCLFQLCGCYPLKDDYERPQSVQPKLTKAHVSHVSKSSEGQPIAAGHQNLQVDSEGATE